MLKTNILHVIDTLGVGGAEKLLSGTVNSLPYFNHHIVYLNGKDTMAAELHENCKISKLNFRSKWDIPRCVVELRRYIRKNEITVVHSHLVMATLISRLACPPDVKLFNSIHSILGSRCFAPAKRLQRLVEKLTYKKRHHLIAVSEEVRRDYDECIGIKGECTVLSNFVDNCFFSGDFKRMSFNGTFRMVTVGNLKPAKNYNYLVNAFKKLPKGIHLDIYGDGPLRKELQAAIDEHKLNIRLCGLKKNVHEVLRNYDLFVMSSIFEGHPVALLEAMASGMPAIVSDIPVLREATMNQGIYFDLSNPADFITKITAIADHKVDLDVFAEANFEMVKKEAGKEPYMQKLFSLYNSSNSLANVKADSIQPSIFRPALNLQTS